MAKPWFWAASSTADESSTVSKVPLLGDMPVFGNLFKTTTKENSKTELIIFLTPRIIDERLSLR